MMKKAILTLALFSALTVASAAEPLWQGKGRIALSSDGNEHDKDDWAATAVSLALLNSAGLQDKVCLYTYCDHIWSSNQTHPNLKSKAPSRYEQMKESALKGADWFGYDRANFVCAVDNPEYAYERMKKVIDESSAENPLIIIPAGPMQVVGEALFRANKGKLKYVTVLSHSEWNNNHAADCKEDMVQWGQRHFGWTFAQMEGLFTKYGVKFVSIPNQNRGEGYGLQSAKANYSWIEKADLMKSTHYKEGAKEWLVGRIKTSYVNKGGYYDMSDSGMILYLLTGKTNNRPEDIYKVLQNPKK